MFNQFCWLLNVIGLAWVASGLRRAGLRLLARHARRWDYSNPPVAGWQGGIDVPWLGTVAFIPHCKDSLDPPYVFEW